VGTVTVMTPEDYQAWLSGQIKGLSPIAAGQELFQQYTCVKCHSQIAPTMANLFGSKVKVWQDGKLIEVTADEDYIRDSIVNPAHQIVQGYENGRANMPSFKDQLSEEQIEQLVAYIKSLGEHAVKPDSFKMRNSYVPAPPATPDLDGTNTQ
jgi:cytochrome c oxidase subunit 2